MGISACVPIPRDQPEEDASSPHVTFSGSAQFLQDIYAHLVLMYGQTLDSKHFAESAIPISAEAAALWSSFRHQAERDKDAVPPCAAGAVGKHCLTTTSHIAAYHLLQEAFLDIKQGRVDLDFLRTPSQEALKSTADLSWPQSVRPLPADLILTAPEHLHMTLTGILTCFNETKVAQHDRAGPPLIEEERTFQARRRAAQPAPNTGMAQSPDEEALSILFQLFQDRISQLSYLFAHWHLLSSDVLHLLSSPFGFSPRPSFFSWLCFFHLPILSEV